MQSQLDVALNRLGVTGPQHAWLVKALHPAGDAVSPGLPVQSADYVIRPEYRTQVVVSPGPTVTKWDLLIWAPPGDLTPLYWALAPSPADFTSNVQPADSGSGFISQQPIQFVPTVVSADLLLTYAGSAGVPPPTITLSSFTSTVVPVSFRTVYRSYTCYLTASSLNNQGTVYSAQFSGGFTKAGCYTTSGTGGNAAISRIAVFRPPLSETDMLLMSPDAYTAPAKEGAYVPLRLEGPTQPFVHEPEQMQLVDYAASTAGLPFHALYALVGPTYPAGGIVVDAPGQSAALPPPFQANIRVSRANGDNGVLPWMFVFGGTEAGSTPWQAAYNTYFDHCTQGVTIFRGLGGSGGAGLGASVTIKSNVGIEVVPHPTSPERTFVRAPIDPAPRVLDLYYQLVHTQPDAYPASYNALGAILPVLGRVASTIWPVVRPALATLASGIASAFAPRARREPQAVTAPRSSPPAKAPAPRAPAKKKRNPRGKPRAR